MKETTVLHVRRTAQKNGNVRYRFSIGRVDLNKKDIESFKKFKFKYGVSMRPQDIKVVEEKYKTKLAK